MKNLFIILLFLPIVAHAQNPKLYFPDDFKFGKHLEVGVTAGSTGFGVEVATPINEHLNIRAGFSVMPSIDNVQSYKMSTVGSLGSNITKAEQERRIKHLCAYLNGMLNFEPVKDANGNILDVNGDIWTKESGVDKMYNQIDEYVDIDRQVKFFNAKVLLDWYPFRKKNWYFTAGIFYGSKSFGKVFNTQEESSTMLGINMYNSLYDQIQTLGEYEYPYFNWGNYSFEMDPIAGASIKNAFNEYGRVAVRVGDNLDGTPNYLEPDENGIMRADAKVNALKPYVGFGYETNIGYDKRWSFGFNAGALFWGKPRVIYYMKNNETIDLARDVKNIGGIVGQYMKIVKYLPVYPVIEVRLAYTIY